MTSGNYFIKSGYRENPPIQRSDSASSEAYWNAERIRTSHHYQLPVYRYVEGLMRRFDVSAVADLGCGVATKLATLHAAHPEVEFIGADQPEAIRYCREHYRFGSWFETNLAAPPAKDLEGPEVDLVICSDVIEHVPHPTHVLDHIKARLSSAGYAVLSTPERDALRGVHCNASPNLEHVREWNFTELEAFLRSEGFAIKEHFLQFPTGFLLQWALVRKYLLRALRGQRLRYNQVCLLQAT